MSKFWFQRKHEINVVQFPLVYLKNRAFVVLKFTVDYMLIIGVEKKCEIEFPIIRVGINPIKIKNVDEGGGV